MCWMGSCLDVSTFTHPEQFFRLGYRSEVTFHEMIDALPECAAGYEEIAHKNGLSLHDSIPFGRAVMLTGPAWDGCLNLEAGQADRLIFNDLAAKMKP